MVRGTTLFKCKHCGHTFTGPDIELNATVFTMPLPCPKCGMESPKADITEAVSHRIKETINKLKKYFSVK